MQWTEPPAWVEPARCDRCGEEFKAGQERAEVINPDGGSLIIHADCFRHDPVEPWPADEIA